jgi:hypothetical protein
LSSKKSKASSSQANVLATLPQRIERYEVKCQQISRELKVCSDSHRLSLQKTLDQMEVRMEDLYRKLDEQLDTASESCSDSTATSSRPSLYKPPTTPRTNTKPGKTGKAASKSDHRSISSFTTFDEEDEGDPEDFTEEEEESATLELLFLFDSHVTSFAVQTVKLLSSVKVMLPTVNSFQGAANAGEVQLRAKGMLTTETVLPLGSIERVLRPDEESNINPPTLSTTVLIMVLLNQYDSRCRRMVSLKHGLIGLQSHLTPKFAQHNNYWQSVLEQAVDAVRHKMDIISRKLPPTPNSSEYDLTAKTISTIPNLNLTPRSNGSLPRDRKRLSPPASQSSSPHGNRGQ